MNARDRIVGFAEGAGEKFQALDSMEDGFDKTKARENVRNAIANHPDMNLVVGIYSYNAPAIVDVVKELDKRAALKVIAFDAEPLAIKHMADGQIDAMIVQNPYNMGYSGIKLMKALAEKDDAVLSQMLPDTEEKEGDLFNTGLKVVVPNANAAIQSKGFDSATEFLTFDEFREWLKKYNLTGS